VWAHRAARAIWAACGRTCVIFKVGSDQCARHGVDAHLAWI
jgi:hypothetical protein